MSLHVPPQVESLQQRSTFRLGQAGCGNEAAPEGSVVCLVSRTAEGLQAALGDATQQLTAAVKARMTEPGLFESFRNATAQAAISALDAIRIRMQQSSLLQPSQSGGPDAQSEGSAADPSSHSLRISWPDAVEQAFAEVRADWQQPTAGGGNASSRAAPEDRLMGLLRARWLQILGSNQRGLQDLGSSILLAPGLQRAATQLRSAAQASDTALGSLLASRWSGSAAGSWREALRDAVSEAQKQLMAASVGGLLQPEPGRLRLILRNLRAALDGGGA